MITNKIGHEADKDLPQGININENTWRLLDDLGAAHHLEPHFTAVRDLNQLEGQQRNGNTGELLGERYQDATTPGPPSQRIERYKLQNALLKEIRPGLIQLSKRLAKMEESRSGTALFFQDSTKAGPFDLVVGADGIKSVVRQHIYPDHELTYTGKIAYRVLIPQEKVAHIEGIPPCATFWHTPTTHVYTNYLPGGLFEIATRALEGEEFGSKVQYGQVATREQVVPHYKDYSPVIRQIIEVPDSWLSFAIFGGPRVERVVHDGSIALIGDASHREQIIVLKKMAILIPFSSFWRIRIRRCICFRRCIYLEKCNSVRKSQKAESSIRIGTLRLCQIASLQGLGKSGPKINYYHVNER